MLSTAPLLFSPSLGGPEAHWTMDFNLQYLFVEQFDIIFSQGVSGKVGTALGGISGNRGGGAAAESGSRAREVSR